MKTLKLIITVLVVVNLASCKNKATTMAVETVDVSAEREAVKTVMKSYKDAIQNLTGEGTLELFTEDATVFESGGVEGTYANYLDHHLGPELGHFNSFIFTDYKIAVEIDLPYAFVTETYIYNIDLKVEEGKEPRIISKKGVATSIVKNIGNDWKIIKTHTSSRNPPKKKKNKLL